MLLQFSVKNFRSFKDEQFITMIPAKIKGHEENIAHISPGLDVLKSAVIYGANASGKSNFVRAMKTMIRLVKDSANKKPTESFDEFDPYRLSSINLSNPIGFSIDFLWNEIQYHYEFSYFEKYILREKLTFYPHNREAKLFEREREEISFGEYFKGSKKLLEKITAPNQLLLSKGAINNIELLIDIYDFFVNGLLAIPYQDYYDIGLNKSATFILKEESNFRDNVKKLFTALDTGISDFLVEDVMPGDELINDNVIDQFKVNFDKFKVKTVHKVIDNSVVKTVKFDLEEESTGTRKLFGLCSLIITYLSMGGTIILDEFERSFHPFISHYIISLFNNPKINKNNAQLIAATHDTTLLSEETKLRRDQIWIVEKNEEGASELFSLADMKGIRDNIPFEKWYLSGRFGGVPNIESLELEFDNAE